MGILNILSGHLPHTKYVAEFEKVIGLSGCFALAVVQVSGKELSELDPSKKWTAKDFAFLYSVALIYAYVCTNGKCLPPREVGKYTKASVKCLEKWDDRANPAVVELSRFIQIFEDVPFETNLGVWILCMLTESSPKEEFIQFGSFLGRAICRHNLPELGYPHANAA